MSKKSRMQVDCAYCHLSIYGPAGSGKGQSGRLAEEERKLLHTDRSPILNEFGKSIIARYGYERMLREMATPEKLAEAMSKYDLDGDGINDGVEMAHGTLADDPLSAPPSLVWQVLLQRNLTFVFLIALSTLCAAVGLFNLVRRPGNSDVAEKESGGDAHESE